MHQREPEKLDRDCRLNQNDDERACMLAPILGAPAHDHFWHIAADFGQHDKFVSNPGVYGRGHVAPFRYPEAIKVAFVRRMRLLEHPTSVNE
jgi:hypothetical protein